MKRAQLVTLGVSAVYCSTRSSSITNMLSIKHSNILSFLLETMFSLVATRYAYLKYCQDYYVDPIYQVEADIKDTTGATRSASYLYLHQEIDSERRFRTYLSDTRDDCNIPLCLLAHSCVQHILYCVFVCFSSSMLQVSLECPFLVA
jgi:hypothetical protein